MCVCVWMRECCVVCFRQPDKKLGVKVLIFWVLRALSVPGKKGPKAATPTLFPHDADTCSIQIACQSDDIDVPARHPPDCNCNCNWDRDWDWAIPGIGMGHWLAARQWRGVCREPCTNHISRAAFMLSLICVSKLAVGVHLQLAIAE